MGSVNQFYTKPNMVIDINDSIYLASSDSVITLEGMTFLRSGVLSEVSTYPLAEVLTAGDVWTQRALPVSADWRSVAYGNGVFVAVAYISSIAATSTDGITWTQRVLPVRANWYSVTYGNGVFVAVANGSTIAATSTDGITWTQRVLPVSTGWISVAYGNGMFVAVADGSGNNVAATSPDGITWTGRTLPTVTDGWLAVCYGAGLFVANTQSSNNANTDIYATSPDGITWTKRGSGHWKWWNSLTFCNNKFIMCDWRGKGYGIISSDGINWTAITMPLSSILSTYTSYNSVTYGNGLFVAFNNADGNGSSQIAVSTDAITWALKELPIYAVWSSVTFANGRFVAVAYNSSSFVYSVDTVGSTTYVPNLYFRVA